jgi:WD40 repeat protein
MSVTLTATGDKAVTVHRSRDFKEGKIGIWDMTHPDKPVLTNTLVAPAVRLSPADYAELVGKGGAPEKLLTLHGTKVVQWDLRTLVHEASFQQAGSLTEAAFSPDGRLIATASESLVVWDAATRKSLGKIEFPHDKGAVHSVHWDPTTPNRFATGGIEDGKVKVWTWNGTIAPKSSDLTFDAGVPVAKVRWSKTGLLLAACHDGAVRVWDSKTPERAPLVMTTGSTDSAVLCAEFSPLADKIIAGREDGTAFIWNVDLAAKEPAKPWATMTGHADAIEAVGFLPDPTGARYLTASRDKSARLWVVEDSLAGTDGSLSEVQVHEILALRKHDLGLTSIQATSDGGMIMTAGRDGRVILWPADEPAPKTAL